MRPILCRHRSSGGPCVPATSDRRVTRPVVGEYKGHPTLTIPNGSKYGFTFGEGKARAILEHLDWKDSEAHAFIEYLVRFAITKLPGYKDAPHGAPAPQNPREGTYIE